MALYLGIDTSNYTTSVAVYDTGTKQIRQEKKLLEVKKGALGLRQSDALFAHVKQLGGLLEQLLKDTSREIAAVGVSATPRDEEGSYMPCFLAGVMAAESVAAAGGIPFYRFSHQSGHVAAAIYGAGHMELFKHAFLAFHVSGGTTQCLHIQPDPVRMFQISTLAQSLDLHAGQAVDRVGGMLGLNFPAGPALEILAEHATKQYQPKPALKGMDCCLSGVENQCRKMLDQNVPPADIAMYCLCFIRETIVEMTKKVLQEYPGLPLLYAGGVMSNKFLQTAIQNNFNAYFAPPHYSADNAAGIALLSSMKARKEGGDRC